MTTQLSDETGRGASRFRLGPRSLLTLVAVAALIVFALMIPGFLSFENITQVLRQASVQGIIAIGVTFVVVCGRLDLSVGSLLSMCAVAAVVVHDSAGPLAAIMAALAIGIAAGCVNGLLVAVLGLNSLIATLGMLSLLQGITLIYSNGKNALIANPDNTWFAVIGRGYLLGIPLPIWIMAVAGIVFAIILTRMTFGRKVVAVGGNEVASVFSAINAKRTIFIAYVISGLLTGLAAIVFASRVMAARNDSGSGYELAVLSGIILGGTSLLGGSGGIGRSVLGIIVLAFIQNVLLVLGLPYYAQWLVTWVVIIVAVWADLASRRKAVFQ